MSGSESSSGPRNLKKNPKHNTNIKEVADGHLTEFNLQEKEKEEESQEQI